MRALLILFLLLSLSMAQESFEEFIRQEELGFKKYLEEVRREFEEYKRIVNEEFKEYKREVLRHWDSYEAPSRKKIVQYSQDYRVKRVFDFEKGELRIEVIGRSGNVGKTVERELEDFLTQTKREAFRRDKLLSAIEKKVKRGLKHVKTATIEREPILTPLVFGKEKVSKRELEIGIRKLLRRGKFYRRKTSKGTVNVFKVKIPPKRVLIKAKKYKPYVDRESRRWKLSPPLVFAIIHTESYFNPLATSPVPAYGLMQIVPHTAGKDATRLLFGKPYILSPSYLYNAENNIRVGTTYLYLLYYEYFKEISDPESRLYCTIAAYNTGPGNVARAFTGTTNLRKAIKIINRMNPKEVYRTLLRRLPYQETKDYLRKVLVRIDVYRNM